MLWLSRPSALGTCRSRRIGGHAPLEGPARSRSVSLRSSGPVTVSHDYAACGSRQAFVTPTPTALLTRVILPQTGRTPPDQRADARSTACHGVSQRRLDGCGCRCTFRTAHTAQSDLSGMSDYSGNGATPGGSPGRRAGSAFRPTNGRYGVRSARAPLALTRPVATASAKLTAPAQRSKNVNGSVSTTFGGVPRVCRGPATHCTAPYGGTRTSTDRPGARSRSWVSNARTASRTWARSGTSPALIAATRAATCGPIATESLLLPATTGRYGLPTAIRAHPGSHRRLWTRHSCLRCTGTEGAGKSEGRGHEDARSSVGH